ncbi:peptide ABC transporter substrate-binding protein [Microbacterium barkeri]|uniref:Peptide ABC transporter substrate-binding protein n=1 Tax=Microbacterium barkeri TaxID=33917 RepID=A0A9W6H3F4_9MICO|nr:ABC transporter substrate-binding protein [Microbacterium barkeri]MDR6878191.1 peptide/nickel transport system substrate-binding protein [Microbacterium barkeri]GLJ61424.1 peptide ABC transporter substrate-binding protein [Microbacterium barkeri]
MFLRTARGRRASLALAAGAAALGLALTACAPSGGASGSNGGSGSADTLVAYTGQSGDYQINFNPFSPSKIGGLGTIYESLFFVTNANTNDYVPLLATEYAWNEDGTQLDITLRDGVTWTDGEAFDADDVVFTFELIRDNPALNTGGFNGEVTKVDATHVSIAFPEPAFVTGPEVLGKTFIVPEHLWGDVDPTTDVMAEPVGTGPYVLGEFKPQAFTLSANEDYWGGAPAVKNVRYLSLSGNTAGADALAAGTIDWQTGPVPDIENVSENYPGYEAITVPMNQIALLSCSNADLGCEGPQTDPAVRQAIYYAMDRDQLNALAFQGTASEMSPTFALLPAQEQFISAEIDEKVAPAKTDLDKVDEILTGAGYEKGSDGIYAKDGVKLELTVEVVTGWTDYITAIDTMSQQLKAAGIGLSASQSSWNEWTDKKSKGTYQLAIDSLGQGAVSDPYYLYNNFLSSANTAEVGQAAPVNVARFSDPAVDEALAVLKRTNPDDTATRQEQFDVIQAAIVEDMPYIPILTGGTTSEYNVEKFSGWPTEDDLYAFPAVWASPDNAEVFKALEPTGK